MGFWEIAFLVWLAGSITATFWFSYRDPTPDQEWSPHIWIAVIFWPLMLAFLGAHYLREALKR